MPAWYRYKLWHVSDCVSVTSQYCIEMTVQYELSQTLDLEKLLNVHLCVQCYGCEAAIARLRLPMLSTIDA